MPRENEISPGCPGPGGKPEMPPAASAPSKLGAVLRATAGNFLEMFDFFLFGLYAAPIGKAFFATGDEFTDTSIAFVVFWFGAAMRPLGAIFLGDYVDRHDHHRLHAGLCDDRPRRPGHRRVRSAVAGLFGGGRARRRLGLPR